MGDTIHFKANSAQLKVPLELIISLIFVLNHSSLILKPSFEYSPLFHLIKVMALSETFGRSDQPSQLEPLSGYKMWNTERGGSDKGGGGLTMLYREDLTAHEWSPPVPSSKQYVEKERQWLLLGNRCAFLHIYIACQSHQNQDFLQWNEDLFSLVTTEALTLRKRGFCCLAMGDFNTRVGEIPGLEGNTPDTNANHPMFLSFINQVNMTIINTLPQSRGLFTRFMNGSRSLLDYGIIDNDHVNTVTSFVIDEDARYEAGSDHALLECVLELGSRPKVTWSYSEAVQYNITNGTDYSEYVRTLDTAVLDIPLHIFNDQCAEEMLPHLSESIKKSAMSSIGVKVKKLKRGRKLSWSILDKIRRKNLLARQLGSSADRGEDLEVQLRQLKAEIRDDLAGMKLRRRHHLRSRVLRDDPCRKKFWRFLKSQIRGAGNITAAYDKTGKMVFEQSEIEEAVLSHFATIFQGQRVPIYPLHADAPTQTDLAIDEMESILRNDAPSFRADTFEQQVCSPYTFTELQCELQKLKDGKASGYDGVPNELLKNTGDKFRLYLQSFLNKILDTGSIPPSLNVGKCMLVHKVS